MTLILAVPTAEGIVLGSDGQITSGEVRAAGQKLFRLNNHCAWAGAGKVALVQRVAEAIGGISVDQPLINLRDQLANAIKQCISTLLQLDFRTPFFQGNPQALLSLHPGDFVFVESRSRPVVLHVTAYGTPEWIDRPYATGNGALFAYALLQKYQGLNLGIGQASILTVKVLEESISVGAFGLGPPLQVWHVTSTGIKNLEDAEIAALSDASKGLRDSEIRLLLEDSAQSTASDPSAAETAKAGDEIK
jgi:proteasome beta subunit